MKSMEERIKALVGEAEKVAKENEKNIIELAKMDGITLTHKQAAWFSKFLAECLFGPQNISEE